MKVKKELFGPKYNFFFTSSKFIKFLCQILEFVFGILNSMINLEL